MFRKFFGVARSRKELLLDMTSDLSRVNKKFAIFAAKTNTGGEEYFEKNFLTEMNQLNDQIASFQKSFVSHQHPHQQQQQANVAEYSTNGYKTSSSNNGFGSGMLLGFAGASLLQNSHPLVWQNSSTPAASVESSTPAATAMSAAPVASVVSSTPPESSRLEHDTAVKQNNETTETTDSVIESTDKGGSSWWQSGGSTETWDSDSYDSNDSSSDGGGGDGGGGD